MVVWGDQVWNVGGVGKHIPDFMCIVNMNLANHFVWKSVSIHPLVSQKKSFNNFSLWVLFRYFWKSGVIPLYSMLLSSISSHSIELGVTAHWQHVETIWYVHVCVSVYICKWAGTNQWEQFGVQKVHGMSCLKLHCNFTVILHFCLVNVSADGIMFSSYCSSFKSVNWNCKWFSGPLINSLPLEGSFGNSYHQHTHVVNNMMK